MNNLDCNASNHSPVWGVTEFLFWKLAPKKWGGGVPFGRYFKDDWVKHNHLLIPLTAIHIICQHLYWQVCVG